MNKPIQTLIRDLEGQQPEVIWEAAKELTAQTTEMVSALMGLLHQSPRAETRSAAAYVLGFGRFSSARSALEMALDDSEEDPSVRGHAAEALAYIQAPDSMGVLLRNLNDRSVGVKYWCAFALGQIGDATAIDQLSRLAETSGDELYDHRSLRTEALEALDEIRTRLRDSNST